MIRLRTKLEVLAIVFFMVSIGTVWGLSRTISDTGDTFNTYIRNSKGNYWSFTGTNIQTAINDLASTSGGAVWLPTGIVNASITLISNLALFGAGNATVLKMTAPAGVGTATNIIYGLNLQNITIADLTVDGNRFFPIPNLPANATDNVYNGIYLSGCNGVKIHDVNAYRCPAHGIFFYAGNKNVDVSDCTVANNLFRGLHSHGAGGKYQMFNDILAYGNEYGGILINFDGCCDTTLSNVISYNNGGHTGDRGALEIDNTGSSRFVVSNCIFNETNAYYTVWADSAKNVSFENCIITSSSPTTGHLGLQIYQSSNLIFTGCKIFSKRTGIYVEGSNNITFNSGSVYTNSTNNFAVFLTSSSKNCTFIGNTISCRGYGCFGLWAGINNNIISLNRIFGGNSRGCIYAYDDGGNICRENIVEGNMCFSSGTDITLNAVNIIRNNYNGTG